MFIVKFTDGSSITCGSVEYNQNDEVVIDGMVIVGIHLISEIVKK